MRGLSTRCFRFTQTVVFLILCGAGTSQVAATPGRAGERVPARSPGFAERLACERGIQEVYWHHRIWPESNPGPKPELSSVLSRAALTNRVEDVLSKSRALAAVWRRPITAPQLRAEIEHMARRTKDPGILGELWESLDGDPTLVAECLARPLLADRLIRRWYAFDNRFHGELRAQAEADLDLHGTVRDMRAMSGRIETRTWRRAEATAASAPGAGTASRVRRLGEEEWLAQTARLLSLFGLDGEGPAGGVEALPVGKLSPLREDERRFYVLAVLEAGTESITLATVTWQKRSFDDWWKEEEAAFPPVLPGETVSADEELPRIAQAGCSDDSWDATPFIPRERDLHAAVWTGAEMLVWGGDYVEPASIPGGRYDPATDTWRPINSIDHPTTRQRTTAVWTGTEMIVWGGWGGGTGENVKDTGGRYDPITDSWTPTSVSGAVPTARTRHTAVWTGTEMIVWGGCASSDCFATLDTGGRYDPDTDSWTSVTTAGAPADRYVHTAVWNGSEMIVWGGERSGAVFDNGGRYDPVTDTWSALSTAGAPEARELHTAVWTGSEMIVWGGCRSRGCFFPILDSGGRYNPATDTWIPTSLTGAPFQRRHHTAVWTGSEMIIWGGCVDPDCSDFRNSGGRYDPSTDSWTPTDKTTAPGVRAMHTAVWTGTEMIVYGGCREGQCTMELPGGSRYSPATDSWVPIGADPGPTKRIHHTAVWTGAEMIVWGGEASLYVGRRYDPTTNRWAAVTELGAPSRRSYHTAVWTGTEMIVWSGAVPFVGLTGTGGRYDPVTDSWLPTSTTGAPAGRIDHTAVWTGTEMAVWGGRDPGALATGGRYDPVRDTWAPISTAGVPSGRSGHSSVWTGGEMVIWGGESDPTTQLATGGRYDPAGDTWSATPLSGAPSARSFHTAVWSGSEMVVWGGQDAGGPLGDGARYDPLSDAWASVSPVSAPAARHSHTSEWTGKEMIVWGGEGTTGLHLTGGRYDPALDAWSPTSTGAFVPFGRKMHTSVWTGTDMIVWGGEAASGNTGTGALYCAAGAQVGPWPGDVDGLQVTSDGTMLTLTWNPSCNGGAADYAVYEGVIGDWTGHWPYTCSTGGATSVTMSAGGSSTYFLVVPLNGSWEGSYGTDSSGAQRNPSSVACMPAQDFGSCP